MDEGKRISLRQCLFLNDEYFPRLYETFIEAFSDYVMPFALTEAQFRNHIKLNGVDLARTAGCEEKGRLVGFSLNGFGVWDGKLTVYDAGTGVIPSHRRLGISRDMFEMMLPLFTESGIEQFLLEVITANEGAIALYESLGFKHIRELALLQRDQRMSTAGLRRAGDVDIRSIEDPDWTELSAFWDGRPSWQNSIEAVERSRDNKSIVGAFFNGRCVGYIAFASPSGRIAQLAVDKTFRQRGVGTALIVAMQSEMAEGFAMQAINVDKNLDNAMRFFTRLGFHERISQFEMLRTM